MEAGSVSATAVVMACTGMISTATGAPQESASYLIDAGDTSSSAKTFVNQHAILQVHVAINASEPSFRHFPIYHNKNWTVVLDEVVPGSVPTEKTAQETLLSSVTVSPSSAIHLSQSFNLEWTASSVPPASGDHDSGSSNRWRQYIHQGVIDLSFVVSARVSRTLIVSLWEQEDDQELHLLTRRLANVHASDRRGGGGNPVVRVLLEGITATSTITAAKWTASFQLPFALSKLSWKISALAVVLFLLVASSTKRFATKPEEDLYTDESTLDTNYVADEYSLESDCDGESDSFASDDESGYDGSMSSGGGRPLPRNYAQYYQNDDDSDDELFYPPPHLFRYSMDFNDFRAMVPQRIHEFASPQRVYHQYADEGDDDDENNDNYVDVLSTPPAVNGEAITTADNRRIQHSTFWSDEKASSPPPPLQAQVFDATVEPRIEVHEDAEQPSLPSPLPGICNANDAFSIQPNKLSAAFDETLVHSETEVTEVIITEEQACESSDDTATVVDDSETSNCAHDSALPAAAVCIGLGQIKIAKIAGNDCVLMSTTQKAASAATIHEESGASNHDAVMVPESSSTRVTCCINIIEEKDVDFVVDDEKPTLQDQDLQDAAANEDSSCVASAGAESAVCTQKSVDIDNAVKNDNIEYLSAAAPLSEADVPVAKVSLVKADNIGTLDVHPSCKIGKNSSETSQPPLDANRDPPRLPVAQDCIEGVEGSFCASQLERKVPKSLETANFSNSTSSLCGAGETASEQASQSEAVGISSVELESNVEEAPELCTNNLVHDEDFCVVDMSSEHKDVALIHKATVEPYKLKTASSMNEPIFCKDTHRLKASEVSTSSKSKKHYTVSPIPSIPIISTKKTKHRNWLQRLSDPQGLHTIPKKTDKKDKSIIKREANTLVGPKQDEVQTTSSIRDAALQLQFLATAPSSEPDVYQLPTPLPSVHKEEEAATINDDPDNWLKRLRSRPSIISKAPSKLRDPPKVPAPRNLHPPAAPINNDASDFSYVSTLESDSDAESSPDPFDFDTRSIAPATTAVGTTEKTVRPLLGKRKRWGKGKKYGSTEKSRFAVSTCSVTSMSPDDDDDDQVEVLIWKPTEAEKASRPPPKRKKRRCVGNSSGGNIVVPDIVSSLMVVAEKANAPSWEYRQASAVSAAPKKPKMQRRTRSSIATASDAGGQAGSQQKSHTHRVSASTSSKARVPSSIKVLHTRKGKRMAEAYAL